MFLIGAVPFVSEEAPGLCGIVMQEIIHGESLSHHFSPSLQNLVTATLVGQADRLTPDLLDRFEGRSFTEDEAFFLTHH